MFYQCPITMVDFQQIEPADIRGIAFSLPLSFPISDRRQGMFIEEANKHGRGINAFEVVLEDVGSIAKFYIGWMSDEVDMLYKFRITKRERGVTCRYREDALCIRVPPPERDESSLQYFQLEISEGRMVERS
jgi:hypothetical protein